MRQRDHTRVRADPHAQLASSEHGSGSGESRDSEVINPLDGLMQDVSGDGREDNDMEEMLKMMKRKSLAPDDVRKLQVLMMRQKGEGK